ncbi:phage major capsid protein [Streptomyces sp. NPDC094154]|uniref:phage major capsid protein n=1 Tax=Streptomyces sp. NPDC094154 TaxID=3366059 RepID=UPI0037F6B5C7
MPASRQSELYVRAAKCVEQAKLLSQEFADDPSRMPAEVARRVDALLKEAKRCSTSADRASSVQEMDAHLREVDWKSGRHVGGAAFGPVDDEPRGIEGAPVDRDGEMKMLGPDQKFTDLESAGPSLSLDDRYGALGVLAKTLAGSVNEREIARFLPESGQKDMLSSGSGGVLVPAPIASMVIDLMRARTVVVGLGASTVPMASSTLKVPRVSADPTPAWLAEGATITPTDGDLDSVDLAAKRLTAIVKLSEELDEDSDPQLVGAVLANSLARSFAVETDRVALRGTGTGNQPKGLRNQSGVTLVSAVGAASYTTLTGFRTRLLGANAECTGFVTSPRTLGVIEDTPGTDGHFIDPPASLQGIPRVATSSIPTNLGTGTNESEIYAGNWSDLLIGVRVGFELRRLDERYADEGKVALRARIRTDIALAHGASFVIGTGVTS